jgi:signal transduction histidine kinase
MMEVMDSEKKIKILMLEDNENDVVLIERVLRKDNLNFDSERVDTRDEFDEAIRRFKPDVVLSDHGLPQFNSREALKICLRERMFMPFILVTGTMSDEFAISILRDGADDYILKSNLSRLPSAIRRAMKERKLERLKREARHALRSQNRELLKVNKELDNFVYSVSHNLKGPLASVMGLLNVARNMDKQQQFGEVHNMMSESIAKLDDTLKEILEYSKNSRNEVQVGEIDWLIIIQSALNKLEYLDKEDLIQKRIHVDTKEPFYSDGNRLSIVFTNLLSNAILYSNKNREAVVDIDVTSNEESAVIMITDNGIGISKAVLPKICDMFYRGTEESQGAGLGLYITKEVVAKLNGTIDIQAEFGIGTTVTIKIPKTNINSYELTPSLSGTMK